MTSTSSICVHFRVEGNLTRKLPGLCLLCRSVRLFVVLRYLLEIVYSLSHVPGSLVPRPHASMCQLSTITRTNQV